MSLFLYVNGYRSDNTNYVPCTVTCATIKKKPKVITKEISTLEDQLNVKKWLKEKTQHARFVYVKGITQSNFFRKMNVRHIHNTNYYFNLPKLSSVRLPAPQEKCKTCERSKLIGKHFAKLIYDVE